MEGHQKKSGKLGMVKNGVFYYIDKNGRKKCHGTAKLKKSQQRVCYKQAVVGGDIVTSCAFMLAAMWRERERESKRTGKNKLRYTLGRYNSQSEKSWALQPRACRALNPLNPNPKSATSTLYKTYKSSQLQTLYKP